MIGGTGACSHLCPCMQSQTGASAKGNYCTRGLKKCLKYLVPCSQAVLRAWLPLSEAVLGMAVAQLPSPPQAAPHRIPRLLGAAPGAYGMNVLCIWVHLTAYTHICILADSLHDTRIRVGVGGCASTTQACMLVWNRQHSLMKQRTFTYMYICHYDSSRASNSTGVCMQVWCPQPCWPPCPPLHSLPSATPSAVWPAPVLTLMPL